MNKQPGTLNEEKREIDLIALMWVIWEKRILLATISAIFLFFGIIVAFTSPKQYKTQVTLLVENTSGSGSISNLLRQVGGLAALGLGANVERESLTPTMYPKIVNSYPFLLEMLEQKMYVQHLDSIVTLESYLLEHNKKGFFKNLFGHINFSKKKSLTEEKLIQTDNVLSINIDKERAARMLQKKIEVTYKKEDNTLQISLEIQEKDAVAVLTDSMVNKLTRYIIDYRTQKSKAEYEFLEAMKEKSYENYVKAQFSVATYKDRNRNITSEIVLSEQRRLESEYRLAEDIYSTIAQQKEQALIKLNERTPVFKVLNPALYPLKKSKPKKSVILITSAFLGLFAGLGYMFMQFTIREFNRYKKEKELAI